MFELRHEMFGMINLGVIGCHKNNLIKKNDGSMTINSLATAFLGDIEKAVDAVSPQTASLPDITIQEDWNHYRDRPKKQKISITGNAIEIFCNYEAIAMILCDRLIQTNSIFKEWGVEEIHIFFGDRAPTKVYVD